MKKYFFTSAGSARSKRNTFCFYHTESTMLSFLKARISIADSFMEFLQFNKDGFGIRYSHAGHPLQHRLHPTLLFDSQIGLLPLHALDYHPSPTVKVTYCHLFEYFISCPLFPHSYTGLVLCLYIIVTVIVWEH